MFHSQSLSTKGPLGSIWVAAYCHKRLKKAQVTATDIPFSVGWSPSLSSLQEKKSELSIVCVSGFYMGRGFLDVKGSVNFFGLCCLIG